eukprot:190051-Pyramimonas_sp.AAC.1
MTYYAQPYSSTPCYAVLYDASLTLSGSLPCSTSDCANRKDIYAMVRDRGRGGTSDMTRAHLACPPSFSLIPSPSQIVVFQSGTSRNESIHRCMHTHACSDLRRANMEGGLTATIRCVL